MRTRDRSQGGCATLPLGAPEEARLCPAWQVGRGYLPVLPSAPVARCRLAMNTPAASGRCALSCSLLAPAPPKNERLPLIPPKPPVVGEGGIWGGSRDGQALVFLLHNPTHPQPPPCWRGPSPPPPPPGVRGETRARGSISEPPTRKTTDMKTIAQFSFLLTTVAVLSACGGGGGAAAPTSNTGTSAASPAPIVPVPATTVVMVTLPGTYSVGSEQSNVFALLNQERTRCGFGALQQDARLDRSASSHAAFLTENGAYYGHTEAPGLPFYTAQTEAGRALAARYPYPVGADLATDAGPLSAPGQLITTFQTRDLLAAPFHLLSLMDSYADLGVGFSRKVRGTTEVNALNITLGRRAGVNDLDPDQVYTYPCQSTTGVHPVLTLESPSPIPSNLPNNNKLYGSPIAVKVRAGRVLALTGAVLTPSAGGPAVAVQIVDTNSTPQPGFVRPDSNYILPLSPLAPGVSYTVQLAGTSDGVPFTKTFSFTTSN